MFYSLLLSFVFTILIIPFLRKVAFKYNVVDYPDKVLKNHEKATPYLGGVAFMLSFLFFTPFSIFRKLYILVLAFLGLYDDIKSLNPWLRMFVEFLIGYFVSTRFLTNPVEIVIATVFYAFLINSVNMMDGVDGICGITSVIAAFGLLWTVTFPYDKFFLTALIGSLIAYLFYNFPPAKIFMGDMGSYTIGGILGVAVISSFSKSLSHTIASLIILSPFFVDIFSSMLRRMLAGKSPFSGDRDHIYDKLFRKLKSKRKTFFAMTFISTLFCLLGILFLYNSVFSLVLTGVFILFLILKLKLLKFDSEVRNE
ncbi:glycosyltransferase family 4 protein [Thermosipho atlanticus]|uniref:UDP-N-acetylmuramyl pentapeptide phosphotransferase/UDP-N-acetylglucosamine-1-phosphate transferase n=1 Tax=Thermosipho atlanticus DSM 15807 TaxID=1123380 RepID=A0A1M5T7V0_9BACT|nr:undecaprenyl-phosphate alpha-N-acetylglucosaminyl 1-phosphate transferase [Thermosipho atlanticus]SHH46680.1 UDP-N-acetylmuramyl pentapeptide phosphotransferase/UDP-N-acetylglucosamine-1-phosphate transferase [Thermosipho atlanticus DSM 15807]